jgi:hypothetical protein
MANPGIDYTTHILIGVRASGAMTVICHWSYLPRQAEVQQQIERTKEPYDTFILCTPTSILRVNGAGQSTAGLG